MKDVSIQDPFYVQLQAQIDRMDAKSNFYKYLFYFSRLVAILLASAITVISGVSKTSDPCTLNQLLILGAITTTLTSIEALFQLESKRATYKLMLLELREIRAEYVFYKNHSTVEELQSKIKESLFSKYQSVMAQAKGIIEPEKEKEN